MVNCLRCGKVLFPLKGKKKLNPKRKYCNEKCRSRYNSREYQREESYRVKNRKKYNKLILKNYYLNKDKWASRTITNRFLKSLIHSEKLLIKKCKECSSTEELEIHHKVYPTKIGEIIDSIFEEKIYYLCKKCHSYLNKKI